MEDIREIDANQVLTLMFYSLGEKALIGPTEINDFFSILNSVSNTKNRYKCPIGIVMPMNNNYNTKLFEEVTCENGNKKIKLIDAINTRDKIIRSYLLTKYFFTLTEEDKKFAEDCQDTIIIYKKFHDEFSKYDRTLFMDKKKVLFKNYFIVL